MKKRRRGSRVLAVLCWVYLLFLLGFIAYLRVGGDRAWLPTILIFSPRWIFVTPGVLLLPTLVHRSCRLPFVLFVLAALFPLMGLCVGWHRVVSSDVSGERLRIVTFNLHGIPLTAPGFTEFLDDAHPDVLTFEEAPDHMNRRDLPPGLTHTARHSELFIASRYPIRVAKVLLDDNIIRYTLQTPAGPVDLIGVHLSSPHFALRDSIGGTPQGPEELARNIAMRADQAILLRHEIESTTDRPLIIAGDFNLAPDSPLFTENFSAMTDAFASTGFGFGWTYFHQYTMVRIDHVIANDEVQCSACKVGPNLGSPHRPLIADLVLRHD